MMKPFRTSVLSCVVVGVCAVVLLTPLRSANAQATSGPAAATSQTLRFDDRAVALMRQSAEFLANQKAMSFNWFVSYDEVIDDREKITFMRSGTNLLVRDEGFFSRAEGENGIREWRYDGKQVTFAAPAENYYATSEFKQGFDALVDSARENMGSEVPLYAIMRRSLPDRLGEGLKGAAYLGITAVAGQEVHHLAFSDEAEDWQVWISTDEERPVPVVIIGTEPKKPGWPQYRAYLTDWNFTPEYDATVFSYSPADGDVQIAFPELRAKAAAASQSAPSGNGAEAPKAATGSEGGKQ